MAAAYTLCNFVADRIAVMLEMQEQNNEINFVSGIKEESLDLSKLLKRIGEGLDVQDRNRKRVFSSRSVQRWLNSLDQVVYEIEDVLDEWDLVVRNLAIVPSQSHRELQVCSSKISVALDIAHKIKLLISKLDLLIEDKDHSPFRMSTTTYRLLEQRRQQSTALVDIDEIHGRHLDREALLGKIMGRHNRKVKFMCIVGLAGIGKTTLAQLVYNDSRVKHFYPFRIWICVSKSFDLIGIAKEIIEKLSGYVPNALGWNSLKVPLMESLMGKRYLLVLDDVWEVSTLNRFSLISILVKGGEDHTVLVTKRNESIVQHNPGGEMYRLEQLSDESCWSILRDTALSGKSSDQLAKFNDVGMKIAKKCKGIPHTAKVLGSFLRSKPSVEEWVNVMDTQLWELEEVSKDIFDPLLWTYQELLLVLRCCFSYCGIIPKGSEVYQSKLIWCWSALGYLHPSSNWLLPGWPGQAYLNELARHSLFQEIVRDESQQLVPDELKEVIMCKLHDIVHDFGQFLRKNATGNIIEGATCQACGSPLVSHVKDYRSLCFQKDPPAYICECLKSLRMLSLRDCGLKKIPKNMIILIHLRFLDLSYNEGLCEGDLKTICKLYNLETLMLSFCRLQEIPTEIGNLIQLQHLDLSFNNSLIRLPESICDLLELRILNLDECHSIIELPEGIHNLSKLTHLHNHFTKLLCPKGLEQLDSLYMLNEFSGELSLLRNLNLLSGTLQLRIPESHCLDDVIEAEKAEMCSKQLLYELEILFPSNFSVLGENIDENISMDILDALQPPSHLRYLKIQHYGGSKLPDWTVSSFCNMREIELQRCNHLSSLPSLGKLPCLKELTLQEMDGLLYVGREFLGLPSETSDREDASSASSAAINYTAFPNLEALIFYECSNWEEWEDITPREAESYDISIMPSLKKLDVVACGGLAVLPHRLLWKAEELEELDIYDSTQLVEVYEDKESLDWKSISHIPQVRLD